MQIVVNTSYSEKNAADTRYERILKIAEEENMHGESSDISLQAHQQTQTLEHFVIKRVLNGDKGWLEAECAITRINLRAFYKEQIYKKQRSLDISTLISYLSGIPIILGVVFMPFEERSWTINIFIVTFIISWLYMNSAKRQIENIELSDAASKIIYSDYHLAMIFKNKDFYEHIKMFAAGIKDTTQLSYCQHYIKWYEDVLPNLGKNKC